MDKNLEFTAHLYGKGQFHHSADDLKLADGFVAYHKTNFSKYFALPEAKFKGRKILETGCGPGKHAVVLALMGGQVTAMDLSMDNIQKGERIGTYYGLSNLKFVQHDFMSSLEGKADLGQFDLISSHNWLQHAENPSVVIDNLVPVLKEGGRIYFSLYHGGTFRFFIAQIARSVLKREYYDLMRSLVKFHFPAGFKEFENPDDIYMENIFDDFFVPNCHATTYDVIIDEMAEWGCEPITPDPELKDIHGLDNIPLRMGFEKKRKAKAQRRRCYTRAVDEFAGSQPVLLETSVAAARKTITHFNALNSPELTSSFCLGLYRLRAMTSRMNDAQKKHEMLQAYLELSCSSSNRAISNYHDTQKLYESKR